MIGRAASRLRLVQTTPVASNRFYHFDDEPVPWHLRSGEPLPWPDCQYFAEVLAWLDRSQPDLGLRFVVTDRVTEPLPLQGDDVVVICIRDELARVPAYAHDVRLVAKTYGIRRTPNVLHGTWRSPTALVATLVQEGIVQARRAKSILASSLRTVTRRSSPRVLDVPLGTYLLDEVPFVPFQHRAFDVSYAGSRLNRSAEAGRRVPTQKMRSRRKLEAAIHQLAKDRPDWRVGIHIIDTFQDAPGHRAVYSRMLMDSRIVLCPRGGSLETYRFFEAVRSGSIPITERLPAREFYTGAPGVIVRDWSELPTVLEPLLSDPDRLARTHEAVLEWWAERCSPAAVGRRLLGAIDASSPQPLRRHVRRER